MEINKVRDAMLEFQKNNNIKNECVTNCIIMRDYLKCLNIDDVKVKSVIVIGTRNKQRVINTGHLVIDIGNDEMIECSHDVNSYENDTYIDKLKNLFYILPNLTKNQKKEAIENTLSFKRYENLLNNGEFCVTSKVYHEQLNYIEKKCNLKFYTKKQFGEKV